MAALEEAWTRRAGSLLLCLALSLGTSCGEPAGHRPAVAEQDRPAEMVIQILHSPNLGASCPADEQGIICRDDGHWVLKIDDEICRDWGQGRQIVEREAAKTRSKDNPNLSDLKVRVAANDRTPYPLPQRVLNMCAKAGVYRISVGKTPR